MLDQIGIKLVFPKGTEVTGPTEMEGAQIIEVEQVDEEYISNVFVTLEITKQFTHLELENHVRKTTRLGKEKSISTMVTYTIPLD